MRVRHWTRLVIHPRARADAWALGMAFAIVACAPPAATTRELETYRHVAGAVRSAESDEGEASARGRYAVERVRITSTTGLVATGWLFRPATPGCYPAVLLQDGREESSGVIHRLPPDFGDVVVLSLDYPASVPKTIRLRDGVLHWRRVRESLEQIPPVFSLGAAYLAQRNDVDSTRLAIVATSFGVPFASIAAAADTRFREVALIYGAGDIPRVLAANLTLRPRPLRVPVAWLAARPLISLAPERFIGRIAPRPVVMVNGIDDPQMPSAAVQRLYDAAGMPKSLTWLKTGHLAPTDSALIRTLVDSAFAKLAVLHAPANPLHCAATRMVDSVTSHEPVPRVSVRPMRESERPD